MSMAEKGQPEEEGDEASMECSMAKSSGLFYMKETRSVTRAWANLALVIGEVNPERIDRMWLPSCR